MASDQTLRAIITVLDRTAEPIHAINARFHAMSLPLREIGSRIGEFAEETGLKTIGEHAGEALERVRGLGEHLLEIAGPLAALSAAGSVAGLVEITKGAAEFAEKLDIGSKMTGIASEQLAGWHYAAGLVNVDVDRLDRGFTYLNRSIAEAAAGKAKDVQSILTHMGLQNTAGHLASTADTLKAVAAEAQHLVDSGHIQLATDMMGKLFGTRAGAQLLPLFEQGPEELAKALQTAQESGISLTSSQTAGGREFMDQYKAMTASVEGLKIAIGNELLPVLTPIVEHTREWLNANREWLATKIGDAVKYFGDTLASIDWDSVGRDIKEIGTSAKWVVDQVGGIGPVIGIVAAISLAPTIGAFVELGGSVAGAAAKLLLFPVASFIGSLAELVPAIGGLRDVWVALDIAFDANPIGAVILAVTALGAVGYEVYEHWSQIEGFFQNLWAGMPDWAKAGIQVVSEALVPFIAVPAEIIAHWQEIEAFFKDLWTSIAGSFEAGWQKVEPIVNSLDNAASWAGRQLGFGTQPSLVAQPGAQAAAGAAASAPQGGQNHLTVDFKNTPPGTVVKSESRGDATPADVNVGYAWMPN